MFLVRSEGVGEADHAFGRAHQQEAVSGERPREPRQNVAFRRDIEVEQDVTAEDRVEGAQSAKIGKQIKLPEIDARAQKFVDLPAFTGALPASPR